MDISKIYLKWTVENVQYGISRPLVSRQVQKTKLILLLKIFQITKMIKIIVDQYLA